MATIEVDSLAKHFGDLVAVEEVSLSVRSGELLCLLGPSGCGKSTTLRCIAGLESPTEGRIFINDEDVTHQAPYDRDCSMVFQTWALFPYKTVLENVTFGLKMQGWSKADRIDRAREILELVELSEFEDSSPTDLSGGQKQRVALARSIAMDPAVLLLDEPLSDLDKRLRESMQIELKNIHSELDKTMVHVTHDQDEAFTLADRIGIMNDGRLVQVGEPREVYANPKNQFVEEFLGESNIVQGTVESVNEDRFEATLDIGSRISLPITDQDTELTENGSVTFSLRPEVMGITATDEPAAEISADGDGRQRIQGTIESILYRGSTVRYYVDVGGGELFVEQTVGADEQFDEGQTVQVSWEQDDILAFDPAGKTVWC